MDEPKVLRAAVNVLFHVTSVKAGVAAFERLDGFNTLYLLVGHLPEVLFWRGCFVVPRVLLCAQQVEGAWGKGKGIGDHGCVCEFRVW